MHLSVLAAALVCLAIGSHSLFAQNQAAAGLAHARTEFRFTVSAPYDRVAPLFGAEAERRWAPGWDPEFVFPVPAKDQEGAVFLIKHGQDASTWTTTAFDLAAGHVQYVYTMNAALATLIDIHLAREGAHKTGVSVVYERTALTPEANEHVAHLAQHDKGFGQEWEQQINAYLAKTRAAAQD
jgi:hypothetical protein